MARNNRGQFTEDRESFMQLTIYKGDGWIVETDDGAVVLYDVDAPDVDDIRKHIGTGRKVFIGDRYGRVIEVRYVHGYFGRYSAPGYLDTTEWEYDTNKRELERSLRLAYGEG